MLELTEVRYGVDHRAIGVLCEKMKQGMPALISLGPAEMAIKAVGIMEEYGISQIPVIENGQVLGNLNEVTLIKLLHDGIDLKEKPVSEIMGKPLPQIEDSIDISEHYRLLLSGYGGVIVRRGGVPYALLSRIDLVNFWTKNRKEEMRP